CGTGVAVLSVGSTGGMAGPRRTSTSYPAARSGRSQRESLLARSVAESGWGEVKFSRSARAESTADGSWGALVPLPGANGRTCQPSAGGGTGGSGWGSTTGTLAEASGLVLLTGLVVGASTDPGR